MLYPGSMPTDFFVPAPSEYIRREKAKARDLRKTLWWRQQVGRGVCYYCGEKFSRELLTMDHKIPLVRGGDSSRKNIVVCCKECNSRKGARLVMGSFEAYERNGI